MGGFLLRGYEILPKVDVLPSNLVEWILIPNPLLSLHTQRVQGLKQLVLGPNHINIENFLVLYIENQSPHYVGTWTLGDTDVL